MSIDALPPLAQLRAFAALAEAGSVTGAGDALNVSHAAVSQQIRALEKLLGTRLTARDGRGTALTEEGARLATAVTEGFGLMTREIAALTGADANRPLQITTTPMFAADWLMPRIGTFREAHPDIDLMLNPTAARVALEPGGTDLAIRFGKGDWPGHDADLLFQTEFIIAAARKLVGDWVVADPAELLHFPWLQEIGTTETNDWLRDHGVTKGRVRSLTHLPGNLLLDGLRRGQGVAATTRAFVNADIARGDMVQLFSDNERGFGYFILTRPGVMRPSLRAFVNWLNERREMMQNEREPMRSFDEIYAIAADRKGGAEAFEALLTESSHGDVAALADDQILAEFAKNIFRAGFNWKVIEAKWPGFEEAFHGFDIGRCAMMDDEMFDALVQDTRIVRHGAKILSVRDNAVLCQELAAEHGSAAKAIADWPAEDYIGLLDLLKRRGTRLGGNTGAYALRFVGRDGFILSRDVVARLVAEGVVDKAPTSKGALRKVQDAFNTWAKQSGRSLTQISRVLAMSVG